MSLQKALERYLGRSTKRALQREHPLVVAVAGSVGKSSTKTAIGIALGAGEPGTGVVSSAKNYNNELGVPLTVFQHPAPGRSPFQWLSLLGKAALTSLGVSSLEARTFVLEMGTDRPGDLAYLVDIAPPAVSVLTAIGAEHTEFFGSIEGVAKEESTIIQALDTNGIAVVNADDPEIRKLEYPANIKKISFGTAAEATARILDTRVVLDEAMPHHSGLEVRIALFGTTHTIRLKCCVGRPQAYAVAAALAVNAALDGDDALAVSRLQEKFDGMPGRMRLIEGIKHTWLIDDSYNSSPLAALSAIRDLAAFPLDEGKKRIAALGDMLELGALSEDSHIQVGRAVAEAGIDMLVACGKLAHVVAGAAKEAGMAEDAVFTFATSPEAGLFIQERMKQGDVVLIKGSQGARMEKISRELMAHPDRAELLLVRQTKDWMER
jgi:UDP-N-acetylmuramoyl-tripeptide--D-alanyl-D-alanine ligase